MARQTETSEKLVLDLKNDCQKTLEKARELQDFYDKYSERMQAMQTESVNTIKQLRKEAEQTEKALQKEL
jgi:SMC interacting uncharacterized protein involved in chromosome segregation